MTLTLSWRQVSAFRLRRHHLGDGEAAGLVDISGDVCGVQAQVMNAARLALWARNHDLRSAEIDAALCEHKSIVKTSCMRQTLHLIPAADFGAYISALRRSRLAAVLRVMARFDIDAKEADQLTDSIVAVLRSGPLPHQELRATVAPLVGPRVRAWMERVSNICRTAVAEGLVCYGPARGAEVTFVRVDQWLPKQKQVPESDAKRALWRRFLSAYGPADLRDFSRWSGIPIGELAETSDLFRDRVLEATIDGRNTFILPEDQPVLENARPSEKTVRLLPSFDPYLLAHADKNHLVAREHYKRVFRDQWWISPVILVDGRIVGVWSYQRRGKAGSVTVEPFEKLPKATHAKINQEAEGLNAFLAK